ncbi:TPA: hypothetical protein N0F65_003579, partial [Lagenidium giganteum]
DFFETFSSIARTGSLRLLLALSTLLELKLWQCDINTAYLNASLKENIYLRLLPGFPLEQPTMVNKLQKALFGLPMRPRTVPRNQ